MESFKKILRALIFPHPAIIAVTVPVAFSLLAYAFIFLGGEGVVSYISFALSAYALTVVSVRVPRIIDFCKKLRKNNKYVNRWFTDEELRMKISLLNSLAINTAFALFQLGLGIVHRSVWFYSLAAYYVLLSSLRYFLFREVVGMKRGLTLFEELLRYRLVGCVMLLIQIALTAVVFFITVENRTFEHHYITTIAMALFTFISMTTAIINVVKYRKRGSPIYSAAMTLTLAAASVSMLTLEVAMLTVFGEEGQEGFRAIMTGATGAVVCAFVLGLAVSMIIYSTKEINKIKRNTENG